jgi:murein DD-endopeptidase MepM/ murein hydrolase activator NlpD
MDDKLKQLLVGAYQKTHDSTDPVINGILEKVKNTSFMKPVEEAGGVVGSALNSLGQAGSAFQNFGNEAINRAGHILSQAGPLTQAFGNYNPSVEKYSGGINYGADIGVPVSTKVALPEGRWQVIDANASGGMNSGYGNSIYVQNLETGEKLRFSHLSKVGVNKGDIVSGGRVVAETGATGNVTGPHLDLEYRNPQGQLADVMSSRYGAQL